MPPRRPHPLSTSTLPSSSPTKRPRRARPTYKNESDSSGSDDGASSSSSSSSEEEQPPKRKAQPGRQRTKSKAVKPGKGKTSGSNSSRQGKQQPTSEDVLLLGSDDDEPLTPAAELEDRLSSSSSVAQPRPPMRKPQPKVAQPVVRIPPEEASLRKAAAASSRPARASSAGTSSSALTSVPTSPSTSLAALPLPLVTYLLSTLLNPPASAAPALGRYELAWVLARHACRGATLSPREEIELRRIEGWTGVKVLSGRTGLDEAGIEQGRELERSIGKAAGLCQKHTHLAPDYLAHLTILQAELTALLDSPKLALKRLSRALPSPALSLPPAAYPLALLHATLQLRAGKPRLALGALEALEDTARGHGDEGVRRACRVGRMAVAGREGWWAEVLELGEEGEAGLPVSAPSSIEPTEPCVDQRQQPPSVVPAPPPLSQALAAQLRAHELALQTLALNHVGRGEACAKRVKELHALLDLEVPGMAGIGGGVLEVPFGCPAANSHLLLSFTPPATLYVLACLVTSLAKRDPTGKRPKKRLFAEEGVRQLSERAADTHAPGAVERDVQEQAHEKAILRAELLAESIGVAIVRSEFGTASSIISKLIAHTHQHALFPSFAAQIALLQAYLAHSTAQSSAALKLYRVAAHLALQPSGASTTTAAADLRTAARLGEAGLLIGLGRAAEVGQDQVALAKDVWGAPGAVGEGRKGGEDNVGLRIAGGLVLGVLEHEILKSKQYMKACLDLASGSMDNTSKPIILSLTAALFVNTREQQSIVMLETALQMARSLGPEGAGGNAALGAWLGEKYEAVMRKNSLGEKADAMARRNAAHGARLGQIRAKASGGAYQPWVVDGSLAAEEGRGRGTGTETETGAQEKTV